jgi:hypothetical protein
MFVAMTGSSRAQSKVWARRTSGMALTIVAGLAASVLAADESKSISRFASRSISTGPTGMPDATRPQTIILPWFSPGVMSQPTVTSPANQAGVVSPTNQASVVPQGNLAPQSSVIRLPAFPGSITNNSANNGASVPGVSPAVNAPPHKRPPPHHGIPEIDPASAANALTLLIGGMLILTDRRRRVLV